MSKAGMKRPDDKESNNIENHKTNISQNEVNTVSEIQGKAKTGNKKAGQM